MQQYTGTKTIMAEPMTKSNAEKILGRQITTSHTSDEGYLVEYPDGYRSWSPKDVFDATYRCSGDYIDRMMMEQDQLEERLDKLISFLSKSPVSGHAHFLLLMQCELMQRYVQILNSRIIFEQTKLEPEPRQFTGPMSFGMAIEALKAGQVIRRQGWNGKNICVFKQVPACINKEIIPNMQSLPFRAKALVLDTTECITYTSQCLIFNTETGRADSWVPSISDVFAEDWQIVH